MTRGCTCRTTRNVAVARAPARMDDGVIYDASRAQGEEKFEDYKIAENEKRRARDCLLYTSPSPRDS